METPLSTLAIGAGQLALMHAPISQSDLDLIEGFAPALVISLTEAGELPALDLSALAARVRAHAHLPISDFGIPSQATMALWLSLIHI